MAACNQALAAWMYKLSGDNQRWQKRYFVLKGSSVQYYKLETDADQKKPRGSIDLTKACGVRKRSQCHEDVEWPKSAAEEASFGVATETRTWYIFADSKSLAKTWLESLNRIIEEKGIPRPHSQDIKGKPESAKSKFVRIVGQLLGKGTQHLAESGVIENDRANTVIGTTGAMVEEQAEMDPTETSAKDRFRTAGGTAVQGAGELTDNEVVGGVTEVAGNQIKADEDTSAGERVAMLLGDSMATIGDSDMIEGPGGDVLGKVGEGISEHGGDVIEKLKGKESDEDDD